PEPTTGGSKTRNLRFGTPQGGARLQSANGRRTEVRSDHWQRERGRTGCEADDARVRAVADGPDDARSVWGRVRLGLTRDAHAARVDGRPHVLPGGRRPRAELATKGADRPLHADRRGWQTAVNAAPRNRGRIFREICQDGLERQLGLKVAVPKP